MPAIFANLLADWTGGQWFRTPVRPMMGFVTDTRMLRPGQVFVALKTPKRDGHDFLTSAQLAGASGSIVGRIILGGWLFSAYYHLCNGIRHLFWDAGYGFDLKVAYRSGWAVVAVSLIATVLSWIVGLKLI